MRVKIGKSKFYSKPKKWISDEKSYEIEYKCEFFQIPPTLARIYQIASHILVFLNVLFLMKLGSLFLVFSFSYLVQKYYSFRLYKQNKMETPEDVWIIL